MLQAIVKKGVVLAENLPTPTVENSRVLIKVVNSCISTGTELTRLQSASQSIIKRALSQPENIAKVIKSLRNEGFRRTYAKVMGKLTGGEPIGYSISGVVVGVGEDVLGFDIGDRVSAAGAGYANHAEFVSVPKNLVVKVPDNVSFEEAATVTLGAIALQGVRRAELSLGEYCVVVGVGILGLITVQLLCVSGVRVIAVDIDDRRLELAKQFGAELTINPANSDVIQKVIHHTGGYGADAVIFTAATASSEPLKETFKMVRKKGLVVLVGVAGKEIVSSREDMYKKELDFRISTSYGPGRYDRNYEEKGLDYPYHYVRWTENRNMQEYLKLLADGKVRLEKLIEKVFPIEEVSQAYEYIKTHTPRPLMVLLDYGKLDISSADEHLKADRKVYVARDKPKGDKINVAIVGVSGFALAVHIPNIEKLSDKFQIKAVVNRTPHKAKNIAEKIEAEYITTDYDEVLADDDIDLVFITTNHSTHAEFTLRALQAGKHVFVEKPLAINMDQLNKIKEFFKENETAPLLMVGFNRRFSKHIQTVKPYLDKRTDPLFIHYRMNAGKLSDAYSWIYDEGGRIIGELCHIIDLAGFLVGRKIKSISAEFLSPKTENYKAEDNISVILKYEDGSLVHIDYFSVGSSDFPKEYMEIHFDGKTFVVDDYKTTKGYGIKFDEIKTLTSSKGHFEELFALYDALKADKPYYPIPLDQIFQTTEVTFILANMPAYTDTLEFDR